MANLELKYVRKNMQILFIWIRLGIKARWEHSVRLALEFVTKFGTLKFVRPLYRDLYHWEDKREEGFCCVVQTLSRSKQIRLYGRWLVTPIVGPRET